MVKVNLPKVEEETRTELNVIKASQNQKTLNETLQFLIENSKVVVRLTENNNLLRRELFEANQKIQELEKRDMNLTYAELEALVGISITVDGGDDLEFMKNCRSGAMKLKTLMEKMKEEKELE